MGKVLVPFDFMAMDLVRSALSLTLTKKGAADPFHFLQRGSCTPRTNCLDAYLIPVIFSLPNIHESQGLVVQWFVIQFHVGKNA